MREVTTTPGHSGDGDVAVTAEGMTIRRPAWCTDADWKDYRERMSDWWTAWLDGFTAGRHASTRTGADQ